MKTIVPSTIQVSTDLLCKTVPSHPGWKEPSDLVAMHSLWLHYSYLKALLSPSGSGTSTPFLHLSHLGSRAVTVTGAQYTLSSDPGCRDLQDPICYLPLPPGSSLCQMTAPQETFGAVSCAFVHLSLSIALSSQEPWSSLFSSSCLF